LRRTFLEMEASKYFSLGNDKWSSQRILALNGWTGYSDEGSNAWVMVGHPF